MQLTIGMACANDPHGLRWTLVSLFNYHRYVMEDKDVEVLVVDNSGCERTRAVTEQFGAKYILANDIKGTALPRDLLFRQAKGDFVLCLDCHVQLYPGALSGLKDYLSVDANKKDLLQGPMMTERGGILWTEFKPTWGEGMLGQGHAREIKGDKPFKIESMGLGLFCASREQWGRVGGFNAAFRGFGGEEGYLHEKFRRAGGKALCLPWLKWWHAFKFAGEAPPYPALRLDMFRNYLIGHKELGWDAKPVIEHYKNRITPAKMAEVIQEIYGNGPASGGASCPDRPAFNPHAAGRIEDGHPGSVAPRVPAQRLQAHGEPGPRAGHGNGRDVGGAGDDPLQAVRGHVLVGRGPAGDYSVDTAVLNPDLPFVSCIMSTYNRPPKWTHLIEESIQSFLQQDYRGPRELVILNDCPEQQLACDVAIPSIRIVNLDDRLPSLAAKFNYLHLLAKGSIVMSWDDDDICLPKRITQAVVWLGDCDWWNPRACWYQALTAGGPEGAGLFYSHTHGYCLNASAWRKAAYIAIGGVSQCSDVDRVVSNALEQTDAPIKMAQAFPPDRPDLWQYIYRWGVQPMHISGRGDCQASYDVAGAQPKVRGTFTLHPYWQKDYVAMVQAKVAEWQAARMQPAAAEERVRHG